LSKSDKSSPRCCSFVFISSKLLRKNFMSSMLISSFFKHKKTPIPIYRDESLVSRVATLVEEYDSSGLIVGNGVSSHRVCLIIHVQQTSSRMDSQHAFIDFHQPSTL